MITEVNLGTVPIIVRYCDNQISPCSFSLILKVMDGPTRQEVLPHLILIQKYAVLGDLHLVFYLVSGLLPTEQRHHNHTILAMGVFDHGLCHNYCRVVMEVFLVRCIDVVWCIIVPQNRWIVWDLGGEPLLALDVPEGDGGVFFVEYFVEKSLYHSFSACSNMVVGDSILENDVVCGVADQIVDFHLFGHCLQISEEQIQNQIVGWAWARIYDVFLRNVRPISGHFRLH